jgi:uncharacterized membrane protein
MSELIVIGYDDKATAEAAAAKVGELSEQHLIRLEKAAVVYRDAEGKVKADPPKGLVHAGAFGGMFWGALIGLLFLMPIAGLAVGAASGALGGKFAKMGIQKDFQEKVGDLVQPGKAALFMVVTQMTEDEVIPALAAFGGEVLRTSLSVDDEEQLAHALQTDD